MAIKHHIPQTIRLRAEITLVEPSQKIIEARASDGGIRRLKVLEVPPAFQWPVQGEVWSIYFENGQWYLGNRYPEADDEYKIESLAPGENILIKQVEDMIAEIPGGGGDPVTILPELQSVYDTVTGGLHTSGGWTDIPALNSVLTGFPAKAQMSDVTLNEAYTTTKYQPGVAGVYRISAGVSVASAAASPAGRVVLNVFKNNSEYPLRLGEEELADSQTAFLTGSGLVYLNGTTDYIHLRVYSNVSGKSFYVNAFTWFSGHIAVGTGVAGGDKSHVHDQGVAAATWTIAHTLNKFPSVSVVDSAGNVVIPSVQYLDANTIEVTFAGATSGKAYLN